MVTMETAQNVIELSHINFHVLFIKDTFVSKELK